MGYVLIAQQMVEQQISHRFGHNKMKKHSACRIKILLLIMVFLKSCIEPYTIQLGVEDLNKYIVSGQVSDKEGFQYVSVSIGSPVDNPSFTAILDCAISIFDDQGNEFKMEEYKVGEYRVWMDREYLIPGNSYKVSIVTPAGVEIVSDFDRMPSCPEVDSIYYEREDVLTSNPEEPRKGLQFYIDMHGNANDSRYYRWEMIETWEYHAKHAKTYYYNGAYGRLLPPDSSTFCCWKSLKVDDIFTLSTKNLTDNHYTQLPLHYVDNQSSRLEHGYSLLIKQFAISAEAYDYWDRLQTNTAGEVGLYEQQPIHVTGNLHNNSNSNNEVLGFFSATSVKEKRIFVENINIEFDYLGCIEIKIDVQQWGDIFADPELWPAYYHRVREYSGAPVNAWELIPYWLTGLCIDCTVEGGTTIKPDFWPY
jgi:hypothetical protein